MAKFKRMTPEQKSVFEQQIRERYPVEGGYKLAEEFNVTFSRVAQVAKQIGVTADNKYKNKAASQQNNSEKKWAPVIQLIRERYPEEGALKIAFELGIPPGTIMDLASKNGIKCIDKYKVRSERNRNVDVHYFSKEWSPNMAYIVGYIYADGCNHHSYNRKTDGSRSDARSLGFHCQQSDGDLIHRIRTELNSKHKIGNSSNGGYPSTYLRVSNYVLVKELERRFGVFPRKSFVDTNHPSLPSGFYNHFVRGFFDGDGTFSSYRDDLEQKWGLVGTKKFLEVIHARMVFELGVNEHQLHERKDKNLIHEVTWYKREDLLTIYNWLYKEVNKDPSLLFLPRKKEYIEKSLGIIS